MLEYLGGDFTNLRLVMSRELKRAITDEQLSQLLAMTTINQNINESEDVTLTEQDDYKEVTVTVPLSSMKLNGVFTYYKDAVLAGLSFLTSPIEPLTPEILSTDDFEEIAIKVGADGFELD